MTDAIPEYGLKSSVLQWNTFPGEHSVNALGSEFEVNDSTGQPLCISIDYRFPDSSHIVVEFDKGYVLREPFSCHSQANNSAAGKGLDEFGWTL